MSKKFKKLFYPTKIRGFCALLFFLGVFSTQPLKSGEIMSKENQTVVLKTTMGDVKIELYTNLMPITTENFLKLVKQGFYDKTIFHRVIPNFMVQGGDPEGSGRGGPGYKIKDEFPLEADAINKNKRGTISMANAGPNTGGSQFFINVVDNKHLDGNHPVFGKVVEGMEIVDKIVNVKTQAGNRPVEEVSIISAKALTAKSA